LFGAVGWTNDTHFFAARKNLEGMKKDALRIIDAALNRAGEGLRVVEDFARFALDDPFLTRQTKGLRHELAEAAAMIPAEDRHAARDTAGDVGTRISTVAEGRREDAWSVCAASFGRSEQALRSLEEYGKLIDTKFASQCESIRYRLYTLEKAIDVGRTSRARLADAQLCVLVDARDSLADFERLVSELVEAGVGMIQLREKHLEDRELVDRARQLVELTRIRPPAKPGAGVRARRRTLAVINDRADVAALAGADGVHLGQDNLSVKDARAIVGPRILIGVSTHNVEQARAAVLDGANYLGAGPTFASQTKAFDDLAGLEYLRAVAAEIRLPTFAIGGIDVDNLADVLTTGISRIAVGAAVNEASEPAVAARKLLVMLKSPAAEAVSPSPTPES
jgi:thiamine-phosphate pyrophosphorylase